MASLNVLDFEKSIAELDENLSKLRQIVSDRANPQNKPDLPDQIAELEAHRTALLESLFANLTPWDKVLLARHVKRPYTLDYISAIFEDWTELHGDRLFADDGAIVRGSGEIGRPAGRRCRPSKGARPQAASASQLRLRAARRLPQGRPHHANGRQVRPADCHPGGHSRRRRRYRRR